jgi:hypothetical protein
MFFRAGATLGGRAGMPALGHKTTLRRLPTRSALIPIVDIRQHRTGVRAIKQTTVARRTGWIAVYFAGGFGIADSI